MKKYIPFRIGKGELSFLMYKRACLVLLSLLVVLIGLFFASAGMGDMKIAPYDVWQAITGNGDAMSNMVVNKFRMPRILIAILVGIALAVAGCILQGLVRNPLASPDIIGITGGASVAVVLFLAIFSDKNNALTVSIHYMPLAAFAGATIVAFFVYLFAWKNDALSPISLVLIGVGFWALTKAATTLFMLLAPIYQASQANVWITGTVYGSSWQNVMILAPWVLILTVISFIAARHLNAQELGDDIAVGLGVPLTKSRVFMLLLSTALIGGAVAFAGGIGFVGLMAPHISRRLVGSFYGALLPVAAIIGAILVLAADLIGRTVFAPLEIPAGVFTSAIGAPYFIYLLYKSRNS
ncbi:FecCD family ABC transporter permease [Bacillus mycoides]|uniref:FecCD family ABC transporter permease n=1 Tax=Bacillus mycoides TaxID=1405 RepID=UPI003CFDD023